MINHLTTRVHGSHLLPPSLIQKVQKDVLAMNNNIVIKELNEYLKGEYMGIHAYERYIKNEQDMTKTSKQHCSKSAGSQTLLS
jgi:hypothetical protein